MPAALLLLDSPHYPWSPDGHRGNWRAVHLPSFVNERAGQMVSLRGLFHTTIRVILWGEFEASSMIIPKDGFSSKFIFQFCSWVFLKWTLTQGGPVTPRVQQPGARPPPPQGQLAAGVHVRFSPVFRVLLSSGFPFFHCATLFSFFSHLFSSCR